MSNTKKCPACAEEILAEAKKCKHCGEILDATFKGQQKVVITQPKEKWNAGIAALLSLFIPGAGQMYKGAVFGGLIWLGLVVCGYACFVIPGVILHVFCILGAAIGDTKQRSVSAMGVIGAIVALVMLLGYIVSKPNIDKYKRIGASAAIATKKAGK